MAVNPRWTTSGWIIYNNKGNPVKQYEPFFSADHQFEFGVEVGVSPTLFYDPVGRVIATLHPNHTWEKVVFDQWQQENWDVNDTVLMDPANDLDIGAYFQRINTSDYLPTWHQARVDGNLGDAEQDAAQKAAPHAQTPGRSHFDSLGRPFLTIANNGPGELFETRTEQDIEGNPLRIIDDRGNTVMRYQVVAGNDTPVTAFDIAGRQLFENSMDAGESHVLLDISGKPIRSWNARGHRQRPVYDQLQRPTHFFVSPINDPLNDFQNEILTDLTIYGESHPDAEALNLRGASYQVYDGAGVVTSRRIDFKGNLLQGERQLAREYRNTVDWFALNDITGINEREEAATALLENEIFTSGIEYDALNRPLSATSPDNSISLPRFNEANLLEQVQVRLQGAQIATRFVENIDYNARGQRERITYATTDGSNFTSRYEYDTNTFSLTRLQTQRHSDNSVLQDLNYAYDPVGNITSIRDNAQQTVFFNNAQIEPHYHYTYDPLYRLIQAQGREHAVQNNFQRDAIEFESIVGIPFPNSPQALQRYTEAFIYDSVGNILSMNHRGGDIQRWNRRYQYAPDSNRLLATSAPGDAATQFSAPYSYDIHGSMTSMPHLPLMQWDLKDQLQASSRQIVNGGTPETTYYVYDASGERLRKVTERQVTAQQANNDQAPTRLKERLYLGGFEIYREFTNDGETIELERQTLHVMDDQQRIALVDTRTQGNNNSPQQNLRYQLSNHLGSASLELDQLANIISYEEYHAYGTSAYRSGRSQAEISLKRYRYSGMERDEETGLSYHGARYYTTWLGRWTAADPIGVGDGYNLYRYAKNNPTKFSDNNGNHVTNNYKGNIGNKKQFKEHIGQNGRSKGAEGRYIFTKGGGWLDRAHVLDHIKFSVDLMAGIENSESTVIKIGRKFEMTVHFNYAVEWSKATLKEKENKTVEILTKLDVEFELWQNKQFEDGSFARSDFSYEDLTSNRVGIEIGLRILRKAKDAGLNTGLRYKDLLQQPGARDLLNTTIGEVIDELNPISKEEALRLYRTYRNEALGLEPDFKIEAIEPIEGGLGLAASAPLELLDYSRRIPIPRNFNAKPISREKLSPVDDTQIPDYLKNSTPKVSDIYVNGEEEYRRRSQ